MAKNPYNAYTPEENRIMQDWYPLVGAKSVHIRLMELGYNRTIKSVVQRAFKMQLHSGVLGKLNAGCYRKGDAPPNKGQKMTAALYEKAKPTMFAKGHLPHNTKADGVISIRKDKSGRYYKHIRIGLSKWVHYQRYIWEQHHGSIPEKMLVVFIDGDPLNCEIENLELITRAENAIRNQNRKKYSETIKNLTDKQVIGRISMKKPELRAELAKLPELIDLARKNIHLQRAINKIYSK